MAGKSSKARQAKLAKRKAKSKQKQKQGRVQGGGSELNSMINANINNPIEVCGYDGNLNDGMVSIMISRSAGFDQVLFATFNVDLYCLGIKDAFINGASRDQFESYKARLTDISPESAKKMIEGAVEFAKELGIKPHKDFKKSFRIFKGVDSSLSDETFKYGHDGKPMFIQGPHDTPARVNEIIRTLDNNCGPCGEGYHLTLAPEGLGDFFDE